MTGFRNALLGAAGAAGGGYSVDNSIVLDDGSSQYLTGPTLSGGSERIGTYSFWTKRANLGTQQEIYTQYRTSTNNFAFRIKFLSGDTLDITCENDSGFVLLRRTTTQVFRDPHAFLHVHVQINGNKTDDTCCTLTINGSVVSDFSTKTNLSSGTDLNLFTSSKSAFIGSTPAPAGYYDGYFSEFVAIDGGNAAATSFGEYDLNGVWRPINVSGLTFGTNGFYLDFAASGDLGNDVSGNANDFTTSGSPTQSSDTPTNVIATLSPLWTNTTLSNGNLTTANSGAAAYEWSISTMKIDDGAGKYVMEATRTAGTYGYVGVAEMGLQSAKTGNTNLYGINVGNGEIVDKIDGSGLLDTVTTPGASVIRIEVDSSTSTIEIFDDGVSVHSGTYTATNPVCFVVAPYQNSTFNVVFDTGNMAGTPSTGFVTLSSANLYTNAAPAIEDGTAYFQATAYEGNGGTAQNIDQSGNSTFQPDFVWIKNRDAAFQHKLLDAIRGVGQELYSNQADAETTDTAGLTSFDSDGFGLGTDNGGYNSANSFVAWQWKGDGTSGSSNTDGSITSTVNVNDTAGFSIVKYTGTGSNATIGHGMSAAPELIHIKKTDSVESWISYSETLGGGKHLYLNLTNTETTASNVFNNTAPTSTVFSVGTAGSTNTLSSPYIAYCWRSIPKYSAFGSYVGNGSSDGSITLLSFRPAFILLKKSSGAANDWTIWDNQLNPSNLGSSGGLLRPNLNNAEQSTSGQEIDVLSNGFKIRNGNNQMNTSGNTYIYAAFSENPFAGSSPATAR